MHHDGVTADQAPAIDYEAHRLDALYAKGRRMLWLFTPYAVVIGVQLLAADRGRQGGTLVGVGLAYYAVAITALVLLFS